MELNDYGSNSHKSKEGNKPAPKKDIQKVTSGVVKTAKKGGLAKLISVFVNEDIDDVKEYIFMEVIVPGIKDTLSQMITNGVDMILYGEVRRSRDSKSRTNYGRYYSRDDRGSKSNSRKISNYDDLVFDSRRDADDVLKNMNDLLDNYDVVTVADLYDLVGKTGNGFTDHKYGWTDIRNAQVIRVRDGYGLRLPKALPID